MHLLSPYVHAVEANICLALISLEENTEKWEVGISSSSCNIYNIKTFKESAIIKYRQSLIQGTDLGLGHEAQSNWGFRKDVCVNKAEYQAM